MHPGPLTPGLALIFDMDGVIVDSMPVHVEIWRNYLTSLGVNAEGIENRIHGMKNDEIVLHFLGDSADGKGVPETAIPKPDHGAAKERLYRAAMQDRLVQRLVPGVASFLERMHGAPLALASNAERANIDFVLDRAGLRPYFRVIADAAEVARPKPAPDLFLLAARRLNIAPRNCIVFEDSPAGVASARAAGMRVAGILTHAAQLEDVDFTARHFLDGRLEQWVTSQRAA
jgi:beta-phosphoglucomutase family hydrolase